MLTNQFHDRLSLSLHPDQPWAHSAYLFGTEDKTACA